MYICKSWTITRNVNHQDFKMTYRKFYMWTKEIEAMLMFPTLIIFLNLHFFLHAFIFSIWKHFESWPTIRVRKLFIGIYFRIIKKKLNKVMIIFKPNFFHKIFFKFKLPKNSLFFTFFKNYITFKRLFFTPTILSNKWLPFLY